MPTIYAVAAGHNIALVSLTIITPQPFSRLIRTPERRKTINRGTTVAGGRVVTWFHSGLTLEQMDTLLALQSVTFENPSGAVTIYTKKMSASAGVQDYGRYNAIVTAPDPATTMKAEPLDNVHWQEVTWTYDILEEL